MFSHVCTVYKPPAPRTPPHRPVEIQLPHRIRGLVVVIRHYVARIRHDNRTTRLAQRMQYMFPSPPMTALSNLSLHITCGSQDTTVTETDQLCSPASPSPSSCAMFSEGTGCASTRSTQARCGMAYLTVRGNRFAICFHRTSDLVPPFQCDCLDVQPRHRSASHGKK